MMKGTCTALFSVVSLHQRQGGDFMAKKIFDDLTCDASNYITYPKNTSCRYCGDRLAQNDGCCSKYCSEKDSVWNQRECE